MLSWSLGGCPSPNLALFSRFRRGGGGRDAILDELAAELAKIYARLKERYYREKKRRNR